MSTSHESVGLRLGAGLDVKEFDLSFGDQRDAAERGGEESELPRG